MTLPQGINPLTVPPKARLDALTEDELFAIIDYQQSQNYAMVGMQFWIDELSRRRTHLVLDQIATLGMEESRRMEEMVRLTAEAAAENARTAHLNTEMRDMTKVMMWLTAASALLAGAAVIISAIALAGS